MKRTKNYHCVQYLFDKDKPAKFYNSCELYAQDWKNFKKQVKRWIRERGYKDAEKRFLLNYVPGSRVINAEDIGALTDGLLFEYGGNVYWDSNYQVEPFLNRLIKTGRSGLHNAGPLS